MEFADVDRSAFFLDRELRVLPDVLFLNARLVEAASVKLSSSAGIQISCKEVIFRSENSLATSNDVINN